VGDVWVVWLQLWLLRCFLFVTATAVAPAGSYAEVCALACALRCQVQPSQQFHVQTGATRAYFHVL
jgi:hypothetical protein